MCIVCLLQETPRIGPWATIMSLPQYTCTQAVDKAKSKVAIASSPAPNPFTTGERKAENSLVKEG